MQDGKTNTGNHKTQWLGAIALPAAVIVSFLLTTQFEIDWWEAFSPILMLFYLAEWIWRWFTAPEERGPASDLTPPDTIVPREAKIGMIVAAAVVSSVLLVAWVA